MADGDAVWQRDEITVSDAQRQPSLHCALLVASLMSTTWIRVST